jgi:hypothetical protein
VAADAVLRGGAAAEIPDRRVAAVAVGDAAVAEDEAAAIAAPARLQVEKLR